MTDPEDDVEYVEDETHPDAIAKPQQQAAATKQKKSSQRLLHSVMETLRNAFQWTTHSIGSSRRNSESIVDNGMYPSNQRFARLYLYTLYLIVYPLTGDLFPSGNIFFTRLMPTISTIYLWHIAIVVPRDYKKARKCGFLI
jgi:hypothetical protein